MWYQVRWKLVQKHFHTVSKIHTGVKFAEPLRMVSFKSKNMRTTIKTTKEKNDNIRRS